MKPSKQACATDSPTFEQAWRVVCGELGIPEGSDRRVALDALFGFGALIMCGGKGSAPEGAGSPAFESSPPGRMPKEYGWARKKLAEICTRDNAGAPTSGLFLRYAQRSEAPTPVETVGGFTVTPDADRHARTLGDEPLTVLRPRTRRVGSGHIAAHLQKKLEQATA